MDKADTPNEFAIMGESEHMTVVCAAILFLGNKILLARRSPGRAFAGFWEFPGGKMEPGESAVVTLRREIKEELGIAILDPEFKAESWYHYPDRSVKILFFSARIQETPTAFPAHDAIRWLGQDEISAFLFGENRDWIIPPDIPILEKIKSSGFIAFLNS